MVSRSSELGRLEDLLHLEQVQNVVMKNEDCASAS